MAIRPSGVCDAIGIQSRTSPLGEMVVATILGSGGRTLPPGLHGSGVAALDLGPAAGAQPIDIANRTRTRDGFTERMVA